ncbi:MAG TPA: hypothetical protein VKB76_13040 [Ktedonobacterales bacterium]|nr:hypothetical protein [Ktedonobacterales bacterium]
MLIVESIPTTVTAPSTIAAGVAGVVIALAGPWLASRFSRAASGEDNSTGSAGR